MYNTKPERQEIVNTKPSFQQLEQELANIVMAARKKPERMPESAFKAVSWFIRMVEPPGWGESLREKHVSDGRMAWVWPYADRVKRLLDVFLKSEKRLQDLIISAREDKVFWRGDDFDFFIKVIAETENMREVGIGEYRKSSIKLIKHAMRHMGQ